MKKIGKMSIIPTRDWMKNMPSKQVRVAAAIAKRRFGQRRSARRDIRGMTRGPKIDPIQRQPKGVKPRWGGVPWGASETVRHSPERHTPPAIITFPRGGA